MGLTDAPDAQLLGAYCQVTVGRIRAATCSSVRAESRPRATICFS